MKREAADTAPSLTALRKARRTQDEIWRWLRWLGPMLILIAALSVLRTDPTPLDPGRGLPVTVSLAAFLFGAFGTLYRSAGDKREHTMSAVALVGGAATLLWTQSDRTGFIALFVALLLLARRLPTRMAISLSAVAMAFLVLASATSQRQSPMAGLLSALTIAGCAGLTMLTQQLRDANEQAEERLEELERTLAAETNAAALAERQHLAREMHDVLAHSLAGLMLQLEGARLLAAAEDGSDPRLLEVIERAHRLGKSGLDEARGAIEMLRGDDLPGPDRLEALARRCAENLGIPCELSVEGEPVELGSQARLALYRAAQEALTNIAKHSSGPERVELLLSYDADGATLTVEDFAATPAAAKAPGYGLTGMRERAELLGGTLVASPTDTGFLVCLKVPA